MNAWRRIFPRPWRLYSEAVAVTAWPRKWQSVGAVRFYTQQWTAPYDAGQPTFETHPELLAAGQLFPGITLAEFADRRKALRSYLPTESLVILAAAPVKQMTDVVPYPFRQDADYLYFTGCQQPEGIAVLDDHTDLCMFMPDRDPEREVWAGKLASTEEASRVFGASRTHSLQLLPQVLPDMIGSAKSIFCDLSTLNPLVERLPVFQTALQQGKVRSLSRYTHIVRWIKSTSELQLMRQAASITCQAVRHSMQISRVWQHEHFLAATVEYECKIRGAQMMAFPSVVGGGANGTVIHYSRNDKQIARESLVLMDVGCELHGYVSDMTRTWPPCGYFTAAQLQIREGPGVATGQDDFHQYVVLHENWTQREVYSVILDVMKECFKMCRPGVTLSQIHNHSVALLWEGLVQLGLVKGPFNLLQFYNFNRTQIGHYLGMDVHDCSTVSLDRPLQPGVVITIEPGLYIPVKQIIPDRFRGIGIRIEDEILITATGYEVLTASVPKESEEIESWLGESKQEDSDVLRKPFTPGRKVGVY